jgi:hypothetical protein
MDIDHAAAVALDECRRQDAHEAGQHEQIRRVAVDFRGERGVEGGPVGVQPCDPPPLLRCPGCAQIPVRRRQDGC